jgi:CheY-like chemotaxis protein
MAKILAVDDALVMRQLVQTILEDAGHDVTMAVM